MSLSFGMRDNLIDFENALDSYFESNKSTESLRNLAKAYNSLAPAQQEDKQELLLSLDITIPESAITPHQAAAQPANTNIQRFIDALHNWQEVTNVANSNALLLEYDRITDPHAKEAANNFTIGVLSNYPEDSIEYTTLGRAFAQRMQQKLKAEESEVEKLLLHKADAEKELREIAARSLTQQEELEKAKQINTQLKQEQQELDRTYGQASQKKAPQLSLEQLQAENTKLTQQVAQVTQEIAALEQARKK